MLCQSNLAPSTAGQFYPSRNTYLGGGFLSSPPSILIIICWTKILQCVGNVLLLHITTMPGHPADPMDTYKQLHQASPTKAANQPIHMFVKNRYLQTVTGTMLARILRPMLQALGLDTGLYSLHSLCRRASQLLIRQELISWI